MPIAQAIKMSLTPAQVEMRENLGNKSYWERRWSEDSEGVCRDLMSLYRVTGEETRTLILDDLSAFKSELQESNKERDDYNLNLLNEAISRIGKEIQDSTNNQIESIKAEITGLKHNDRRQDARLDKLEHQFINSSIKLDHVEAHTKQLPQIMDSINELHGTVNHALSQIKPPAPPKSSKIPSPLWATLGVMIVSLTAALATAMTYWLTGEVVIFGK